VRVLARPWPMKQITPSFEPSFALAPNLGA